MADNFEVFRTLVDSSGDGAAIDKLQHGNAATSKVGHIVFTGWNQAGNATVIEQVNEGASVLTENQSAFTAKDNGGNAAYLNLNSAGELLVTSEGSGTEKDAQGTVAATKGSDVIAATMALTASKLHDDLEFSGSSTKPVLWKVEWVDDDGGGGEVVNTIMSFITGAGDFSKCFQPKNASFTTGGVGTQTLRISGNQLTGSGSDSDLHAYLGIRERA